MPAQRSYPDALQKSSSLLTLPPEIICCILQELLVSAEPLRGRLHRPYAANFFRATPESYHLYPAILQTCHSLYSAGWSLLYGKNILCLEIGSPCTTWPGPPAPCFRVPKSVVWIPAFEEAPLVQEHFKRNLATSKMELVDRSKHFALRFSKLKIEVPILQSGIEYWRMEGALPVMKPIFETRYLEVSITPDTTPLNLRRYLPFLAIRCRDFKLTGAPPAEIERVTQIITSRQPVPDVESACRALDEAVAFIHGYSHRDYTQARHFRVGLAVIGNEMQIAEDEFDMEKLATARDKVLALVTQVAEYTTRSIMDRIASVTFENVESARKDLDEAVAFIHGYSYRDYSQARHYRARLADVEEELDRCLTRQGEFDKEKLATARIKVHVLVTQVAEYTTRRVMEGAASVTARIVERTG